MMKYVFSAVIPLDNERKIIFDQVVKRFATSYSIRDKTLYAEYEGTDQGIADALVMTFEKYAEHEVSYSSS